jgi:hypothetical protein
VAETWYLGAHTGFLWDGEFIFGAMSYGYKTHYHFLETPINKANGAITGYFDSHLFKYNPDLKTECFYNSKLSKKDINTSYKKHTGDEFINVDTKISSFKYAYKAFKGTKVIAKHVAPFPLLCNIKAPRMCSLKSA